MQRSECASPRNPPTWGKHRCNGHILPGTPSIDVPPLLAVLAVVARELDAILHMRRFLQGRGWPWIPWMSRGQNTHKTPGNAMENTMTIHDHYEHT